MDVCGPGLLLYFQNMGNQSTWQARPGRSTQIHNPNSLPTAAGQSSFRPTRFAALIRGTVHSSSPALAHRCLLVSGPRTLQGGFASASTAGFHMAGPLQPNRNTRPGIVPSLPCSPCCSTCSGQAFSITSRLFIFRIQPFQVLAPPHHAPPPPYVNVVHQPFMQGAPGRGGGRFAPLLFHVTPTPLFPALPSSAVSSRTTPGDWPARRPLP